jgi:hypothetical protein
MYMAEAGVLCFCMAVLFLLLFSVFQPGLPHHQHFSGLRFRTASSGGSKYTPLWYAPGRNARCSRPPRYALVSSCITLPLTSVISHSATAQASGKPKEMARAAPSNGLGMF